MILKKERIIYKFIKFYKFIYIIKMAFSIKLSQKTQTGGVNPVVATRSLLEDITSSASTISFEKEITMTGNVTIGDGSSDSLLIIGGEIQNKNALTWICEEDEENSLKIGSNSVPNLINIDTRNNSGKVTITNLEVTDTLGVTHNTTIGGKLDVTGDTKIIGTLELKGDVVIGEDSSDLLVVNSETKFMDKLTVGGGLDITLDANIGGKLDVTGDTSVSTFDSIGATSLATGGGVVDISKTGVMTTVKGTLNVNEAVTLDNTLEVTDDLSVASDLNIQGKIKNDLVIGENSTDLMVVNSKGIFTDGLDITLDANIGGKLDVTGDTSVSTFDSIGATSLATGGGVVDISKTGVMTTVKGTFNVDEAVTLENTLEVAGDTSVGGTLGVTGDLSVTSNLNIQGKIKNDLVIGEDSSDLLVVNSETKFTGTVEGSITGNAATATKLNNSTDQNITNIKDLFNIDYSTHSASINFKNIENLNNKLNFLIDLLKLAMPNLT